MNKQQIFQQITQVWNEQIPFNKLLGIRITQFDPQCAEIRFKWQDSLIGNPLQKILHGGVTASALDFAGGVVCAAGIIERLEVTSVADIQKALAKLGTIDLRTDYLRPGRGEEFITTAKIIRSGNKVAVARMELHNEQGDHIAFGTGTYMVG